MNIIEKIQSSLLEHTSNHRELPDFILLNDEEYGELVGLTHKSYSEKVNDRRFWGVPIVVCESIESFTFGYTEKRIKLRSEIWLVGEDDNGMFVDVKNHKEYIKPANPRLLINGYCIGYDLRQATAKELVKVAIMNTNPPLEK